MPNPPPVVMFRIALVDCLTRLRNASNKRGDWSGRPVSGSRAWRWSIAAPASAAAIASAAISSGVIGKCGDMLGVWIDPVTAQVMIALLRFMGALHSSDENQFLPGILAGIETAERVGRSEERRLGKGCVSTCRYRWAPDP